MTFLLQFLHELCFWVGAVLLGSVATLWILWQATKAVARLELRRKARRRLVDSRTQTTPSI